MKVLVMMNNTSGQESLVSSGEEVERKRDEGNLDTLIFKRCISLPLSVTPTSFLNFAALSVLDSIPVRRVVEIEVLSTDTSPLLSTSRFLRRVSFQAPHICE